ncbi:putative Ig domain-containing protein [Spirosoma sp. SC4-14]|uniref:putative Ig domain-containing protein n=1 Tax=Spirosoma sp. SC4-14 TaxID=3128900 RepID=UPI0030D0C60A
MIKLLSNLLQRAGIVKTESITGANSAARIGSILEDLSRIGASKFDAVAVYDTGQYAIYNGILAEVLTPTNPGESPDSAPAKWSLKLVIDPIQVTAGNKLPVAASALKTLVDQIQSNGGIPNASTTQRGAARQATDQEAALGANNDSYTTPKQLNDRLANFYSTYADAAIDKFAEDATDETLDAFMAAIIGSLSVQTLQLLCNRLASIGCNGANPQEPTLNLVIVNHYEEQLAAVSLPSKAAMDSNQCTNISGWVSGPDYPGVVRIVCDGLAVGYATATLERPDVRDALNELGANTTKTIFGFNWIKPATFMDGQEHTWQLFVGDSEVEATDYNVPQQKTCGEPSTPDPYVTYYKQSTVNSIEKGGAIKTVTLIEVLSDNSERPYSGTEIPSWSLADSPAGIVFTPNASTKSVDISATSAAEVDSFKLQCSLTLPQTIQVLSVGCTRPPSGLNTYQLSWHFVPDGGYARLYTTLDDACTTAGKRFDGTELGNLDPFTVQAANLNIGTEVFLGTGTSCEKAGDNIYYVLDNTGGNTVLKAIQVANGVIVAVKDSTYSTSQQNHPPTILSIIADKTVVEGEAFSFDLEPGSHFSDPDGDMLTYHMGYYTNIYQDALPSWANYSLSGVFSGTAPVAGEARDIVFRLMAFDGVLSNLIDFVVHVTPVSTPVVIDSLVLWAKEVNSNNAALTDFVFLYRGTFPEGTTFEDQWDEYYLENSETPEFTPGTSNPNTIGLPEGYQDYNVYMAYPGTNATNTIAAPHHIRMRKTGETDLLLDLTFDPDGMAVGDILTIYTAP